MVNIAGRGKYNGKRWKGMENLGIIVTACLVLSSAVTFVLYGVDKARAKRGKWRISERTLLLWALFLGAFGAAAGMGIFRHKTRHLKFRILVPMFCCIHVYLLVKVWGFV